MITLLVSDISIPRGRRPVQDIATLADSIKQVGLLNPIVVSPDHTLIAGRNRLEACRSLGWKEIPVTVVTLDALHQELAEIDENVVRNELTILERSEKLSRRKEIYEALHPSTAKPGGGRPAKNGEKISPFSKDTAHRTGVTARTVQQEVQIAKGLSDRTKTVIRDTPIADKKADLLKLARMTPEKQERVASKLVSGEVKTIVQAEDAVLTIAEKAKAKEIREKRQPERDPLDVVMTNLLTVLGSLDAPEGEHSGGWGGFDRVIRSKPAKLRRETRNQLAHIVERLQGWIELINRVETEQS